jgi:hypothetical protein
MPPLMARNAGVCRPGAALAADFNDLLAFPIVFSPLTHAPTGRKITVFRGLAIYRLGALLPFLSAA